MEDIVLVRRVPPPPPPREPRVATYPAGSKVEEGDWFVWGEGPRATLARVRSRKGEPDGPWYVVWDEGYGHMTLLEAISVAREDYAIFSPDMGDLAVEEFEARRDVCSET